MSENKNRCILLTGASSVIGSAIAQKLASPNVCMALHFHRGATRINKLAKALNAKGCRVETFQSDLTIDGAPVKLLSAVRERLCTPLMLVNNAGAVFGRKSIDELTVEDWRLTFRLNTEVPFFLTRELIPAMKKVGFGRIVNISSIGVKFGGSPKTIHYSCSKGALETLTVGLSGNYIQHGITINNIRPGFIKSNFHKNLDKREIESRINLIPMGKSISPEEIGAAVAYLLSPETSSVTGQTIAVSGGE